VLNVHNTADARGTVWALDQATISAHWGEGFSTDHTATYRGSDMEFPSEFRGRPRVWVSKNKHANYRTKGICDWMYHDYCDPSWDGTTYEDVEVLPGANLGNMFDMGSQRTNGVLLDPISSRNAAQYGYTGVESFWYAPEFFAGWKNLYGQALAGTYRLSLSFFQF